jgi:hypothetical protein
MQIQEANIGETLARYGRYISCVHLADGAARTEPGSLPFDYPGFGALKSGATPAGSPSSPAPPTTPRSLARALLYLKREWSEA